MISTSNGPRRRQSAVEFIIIITICFVILSLLTFEPLARNSVQNRNSAIDLPLRQIEDGNSIINGGVGRVKICPSALNIFANKSELEIVVGLSAVHQLASGNSGTPAIASREESSSPQLRFRWLCDWLSCVMHRNKVSFFFRSESSQALGCSKLAATFTCLCNNATAN